MFVNARVTTYFGQSNQSKLSSLFFFKSILPECKIRIWLQTLTNLTADFGSLVPKTYI